MSDLRAAVLPKPFAFTERKSAFLKIIGRGVLLELATFGFYRFWMNTDIRRHLWSHTAIGGDALEYTGTGRELLIGFLFALAILGPTYFLYFLLGVEAERQRAFASFPLVALFYLFGQFAVYRARRYRLTRTVWRGVRFNMTGSGVSYAWRAALWALAVVVSLGLAYPARAAALERFKMRNTSYGDLAGDFVGTGAQFFDRAGWIWLTCFVLIAADAMILILMAPRFSVSRAMGEFGPLVLVPSAVALPLFYAAFKAAEWRWWAENLRLGGARFSCDLSTPSYIWLFFKFLGAALAVLAAGLLIVGLAAALTLHGAVPAGAGGAATKLALKSLSLGQWAPLLAGYLIMLTCLGLVQRYFLQHQFWGLIVSSLSVRGDAIAGAQKVEVASALGEGLVDGLDFGF